ncbi:pentatricopeptide repeat domain-containing protein 3, mitochondrial isoform X1 [Varanus komodoensis]|nr:pentatricopeptide repeat domain-containing protein 3, mitochondrial isoform X1 [Varanus komodoensis]
MAASWWWRLLSRSGRQEFSTGNRIHSGVFRSFAEQSLRHSSENVTLQEKSPSLEVAEESIRPRKKTWDKLAVLQALASTVNRDTTAAHFMFQDDPYLIPRTSTDFRIFSLSKESGKNAAKYIVETHPNFFEKDIAEPHIPCLMPEGFNIVQNEDMNESTLKNQIQLRKVKASVEMYDQLLQAGACISLETSNSLLDLLCFYGDREPGQKSSREDENELEELEDVPEKKRHRGNFRNTFDDLGIKWRKNNNAERIFNLMPEKNAHSYCTMIRGMVKHRAYTNAFDMYTELQNNRLNADVHTFNALISAAAQVKEKYSDRVELVDNLLRQMAHQNVQPNLLTFNSLLKTLRLCGPLGKSIGLRVLKEMNALNIEPSLATFDHLLGIFHNSATATQRPVEIIYDIIDEIEGKSFYPRDPDDGNFFSKAMKVCLDLKDIQLAYKLHRVVKTGENRKMMGTTAQQASYWGRFFKLLCLMEQLDVVLKWYKQIVPSMFYPNSNGMLHLLQALDTASHLEIIPQIWKDIKQLGHGCRPHVVEEVLALMARDTHSAEIQLAFADCAADIVPLYEIQERRPTYLQWTATSLSNSTVLFARAGRTAEAWNMLELFRKHNRIPSDEVMNEVLNCIKQNNQPEQALDLVKMTADFSLPCIAKLIQRVQKEFQLSEEQRSALADMSAEVGDSSDEE